MSNQGNGGGGQAAATGSIVDQAKALLNKGRLSYKVGEGLIPEDDQGLWRIAQAYFSSGWAPKGYTNVEAVFIAMACGGAVGLAPLQAIQCIAVVNGRPTIYGDAALALVRASGQLEAYQQTWEGEGDARCAVVSAARKGFAPLTQRFSAADAKKAKLWDKDIWKQYPDRMLMWRARGFILRDLFGDILQGLATTEEARDESRVESTQQSGVALEALAGARVAETPAPALDGLPLEGMQLGRRELQDAARTLEQVVA